MKKKTAIGMGVLAVIIALAVAAPAVVFADTTPDNLAGTSWYEGGGHINGPVEVRIQEGQSQQVKIDVEVENDTPWYVEWKTGNVGIASISGSDNAGANLYAANPGTTTCTISLIDRITGNVMDTETFPVIVDEAVAYYVPVNGVGMSKGSMNMTEGEHSTLAATVYPANATNKDLDWYSSDDRVICVQGDGIFYAAGAGDAVVYARSKDSGAIATCNIHVITKAITATPVTDVALYPTTLSLGLGQSAKLQYQVYPVDATNQEVYFTSDNTKIATVTPDAVVTGQGTGVAHITVETEDNQRVAVATVTVGQ